MTNEDKKRIAEYMGWITVKVGTAQKPYLIYVDGKDCNIHHDKFDSNDGALCVQEMQKQEDYLDFILIAYRQYDPTAPIMGEDILFFAWLMAIEDGQAKNFFEAFTEWRKGK